MKHRRIQYNSPVILSFAIASFIVLILDKVTGGISTAKFFSVYRSPFTQISTYPRLIFHVLGHSSYSHYIGNILLMLVIGPAVEERCGSVRLLISILLTALITGLVQMLLFPHSALLGASGIVFMLIVMASFSGMRGNAIPMTLILVVIFYLGGEIIDGLTIKDNISQLTHIIGGVCGAVAGFTFMRRER